MSNFERQFFEYFQIIDRRRKLEPLILGGITASGGGTGAPIGGFIGQLPQSEVCYDLEEAATLATVVSGESLVDNLNHIRYRLNDLDTLVSGLQSVSGGGVVAYEDAVLLGLATEIDFSTNLTATYNTGRVTVVGTAGGSNVNKIIRTNFANTTTYEEYEKSDAGLAAALADAVARDILFIPAGSYDLTGGIDISDISIIGEDKANTTIYVYGGVTDVYCLYTDPSYTWEPNPVIKNISIYLESDFAYTTAYETAYGAYIKNTAIHDVNIEVSFEGSSVYFNNELFVGCRISGGVPVGIYDELSIPITNFNLAVSMEYCSDTYVDLRGLEVTGSVILETFNITVRNEYGNTATGLYIASAEIIRDGKVNVYRRIIYQTANADTTGVYSYTGSTWTLQNVHVLVENEFDSGLTVAANTFGFDGYYSTQQYTPIIKDCFFDVFVDTGDADGMGLMALFRTGGPILVENTGGLLRYRTNVTWPNISPALVTPPVIYYVYPYDSGYGIPRVRFTNCGFYAKEANSPYDYLDEGEMYNMDYIDIFNSNFGAPETTMTHTFYSIDPLQCYRMPRDTDVYPSGEDLSVWENYYGGENPVVLFPHASLGNGRLAFRMPKQPNMAYVPSGILVRVYCNISLGGYLSSGVVRLELTKGSDPGEYYPLAYSYGHGIEPPIPAGTFEMEAQLTHDGGDAYYNNNKLDHTWWLTRASGEGEDYYAPSYPHLAIEGIRVYYYETVIPSLYNYELA